LREVLDGVTWEPCQITDHFTSLEEEDPWNALHSIFLSVLYMIIYVYLSDLNTSLIVLCDRLEVRSEDSARTTPRGPKVDENRDITVEDLVLKGSVADINILTHG
jgi:hypothetical protein